MEDRSSRSPAARFVIETASFVRENRELSGAVAQAELERVAAETSQPQRELIYRITGEQDRDGRRWLTVAVEAELDVTCQRCLQPMTCQVASESRFLLLPPGADVPEELDESDELEWLEMTTMLDLAPILEDEILLALPIAPRHAQCELPAGSDEDSASPFAALAGLHKSS